MTLEAPIRPKKFFHTAGNFREHEEESKVVDWSHQIAPWINFFQNVDAIVGPDEPVGPWSLFRSRGLDRSSLVVWPTAASPLVGPLLVWGALVLPGWGS